MWKFEDDPTWRRKKDLGSSSS